MKGNQKLQNHDKQVKFISMKSKMVCSKMNQVSWSHGDSCKASNSSVDDNLALGKQHKCVH